MNLDTGSAHAFPYGPQQQQTLARGISLTTQTLQNPPPILLELEELVKRLADVTQRDDLRLKALQEISSNYEDLSNTPVYQPLSECLIRIFLKVFQDTAPQFIGENNTQQLRKLMLEMLYRMGCSETIKSYLKLLHTLLSKAIISENEENAITAIKVMCEHLRVLRPVFTCEVMMIINHLKAVYMDMAQHITVYRMFEQQGELRPCNTIADFIPVVVNYINLSIPNDQRSSTTFNTTLAEDFYTSQIRALTFLSYISRTPLFNANEIMFVNGPAIVDACFMLMRECPPDALSMRRDIISSLKNFFQGDMRLKFVAHVPKLLLDSLVLGTGYTVNDQLRQTVMPILADVIHNIRMHLPYSVLISCAHKFSKIVLDITSLPYTKAMASRLMVNLVDAFTMAERSNSENPCRDLFFAVLDTFSRKLKIIAQYHIPLLIHKNVNTLICFRLKGDHIPQKKWEIREFLLAEEKKDTSVTEKELKKMCEDLGIDGDQFIFSAENCDLQQCDTVPERQSKCQLNSSVKIEKNEAPNEIMNHYWAYGAIPMNYQDAKNLIKVSIMGCKHITHGLRETHATTNTISVKQQVKIYDRIFRYGVRCLGIYAITNIPSTPFNSATFQRIANGTRSKEEKEVLDMFGSIFSLIEIGVFKEIMSNNIEYFVEHIAHNFALQMVFNSFFVNASTSAAFGNIVMSYLMDRLPDMAGKPVFLLFFPYLHEMVHRAMQYALRGREPINYFLLLRALFRSIGGGSYEQLYQSFLPLLPSLLQQLNRLQSGIHRRQLRELFVELCLTVPVRLSSLLPYMPLLMDPLVYASNGSPTLIQQGLRTLELCVDNLAPEYLQEHIAPVKAQLMHGLWKALSLNDSLIQLFALRILGKFGASNRNVMCEPQELIYTCETSSCRPSFQLVFQRSIPTVIVPDEDCGSPLFCELHLAEIVSACLEHLRSLIYTDMNSPLAVSSSLPVPPLPSSLAIRRHSFKIVRGIILCALLPLNKEILINSTIKLQITNHFKNFGKDIYEEKRFLKVYKCKDEQSRQLLLNALTAVFFADAYTSRDLHNETTQFFKSLIQFLILHTFIEPDPNISLEKNSLSSPLDSAILIDAIIAGLADPTKEICHYAVVLFTFMKEIALASLGDIEKVNRMPIFHYIIQQVIKLCYKEAWHSRLGGCTAIKYLCSSFPRSLIVEYISDLLSGLFEVIAALRDEVSSSAIDIAISAVNKLVQICCGENVLARKDELIKVFVIVAIDNIQSPSEDLRNLCKSILSDIATLNELSVSKLLASKLPDLEILFQTGMKKFQQMSLFDQIAFLDVFAYIYSLNPLILFFTIDGVVESEFVEELNVICNGEDSVLLEKSNYHICKMDPFLFCAGKKIDLNELRFVALRATIACYISSRLPSKQQDCDNKKYQGEKCEATGDLSSLDESTFFERHDRLLIIALKCLTNGNQQMQEAAFLELQKSAARVPLKLELLKSEIRPMLMALQSQRATNSIVRRLLYLVRLTPYTFNSMFADQLLTHFRQWIDLTLSAVTQDDLQTGKMLLEMLSILTTDDVRFIEVVIPLVAKWEAAIVFSENENWRYPLLKFLIKCPLESIRFFVSSEGVSNEGIRELFKFMIKHKEGESLRKILITDTNYLTRLLDGEVMFHANQWLKSSVGLRYMEYLALQLIWFIVKTHKDWLNNDAEALIKKVQNLWNDNDFRLRYSDKEYMDEPRYAVPKLVVSILLQYFRSNIDDIDILFDLCFVFAKDFASDFSFVRLYIEQENFSISWRQRALKLIVKKFVQNPLTAEDDNVVRMLQYVVIPSLHYALQRCDVDEVVGAPPNPDVVDENSLVSLVCENIMNKPEYRFSDAMMITLYHLGCLFVSNCPTHIHDVAHNKKQSNRLRILMVLGWPCLQPHTQDLTRKYMGHLLVVHIINKYSINRKIVLRVFHILLKAHFSDPREIVKKCLDILIPSIPLRMDDGHAQMVSLIKKTIIEEGNSAPQLLHCISTVVRQYLVFYPVRHQLIHIIINSLHRLMMLQSGLDSRRVALDVCEMVIKWEQYRISQTSANMATASGEVILEEQSSAQKTSALEVEENKSLGSTQVVGQVYATGQDTSISGLSKVSFEQQPPQALLHSILPQNGISDLHQPISKMCSDQVIGMLLKMAASVPDTAVNQQAILLEQLTKRSLSLLKTCLQPTIWGLSMSLKAHWIEKQLSSIVDTSSQQFREPSSQQLQQIQGTLDMLTQVVTFLPQETVARNIQMVQRGIIPCLNCQLNPVMRSLYQLIDKLFERTKSSPEGLDELDNINQYIIKFINDSFTNYEKGLSHQSFQGVFGTIHLLRTICTRQPAYIDTTCLSSFTKAVQRIVREYITTSSVGENKGLAVGELIIYSLDILRPRIHAVSVEARRTISQYILQPLIDKIVFDRILESVIKIVDEMVRSGDNKQPNHGVPLLIRLVQYFDSNKKQEKCQEMLLILLGTVLHVYETPHLRTPETVAKLNTAYYWGLSINDEYLRQRFFKLFNSQVPKKVYERLYHILALENWEYMQSNFWIKHCINLMLASIIEESPTWQIPWRANLLNSAKFLIPADLRLKTTEFQRNTFENEQMDMGEPVVTHSFGSIVDDIFELFVQASDFCVAEILPNLIELIYNDDDLASKVWSNLFPSLWSNLRVAESASLQAEITPFLVSAVHLPHKDLPKSAYIGQTHRQWYQVILLLEKRLSSIPVMLNNEALFDLFPSDEMCEVVDVLFNLQLLYSMVSERDQYIAIIARRARYIETVKAIKLFNQDKFEETVDILGQLIDKTLQQINSSQDSRDRPTPNFYLELNEWRNLWIESTRELNHWDELFTYANSTQNLPLLSEACWHLPSWTNAKECLSQLEGSSSPSNYYKILFQKTIFTLYTPVKDEEMIVSKMAENLLNAANEELIKEWARLPSFISSSHVHILQAIQMSQEIREATVTYKQLVEDKNKISESAWMSSVLNYLRSVLKTWRFLFYDFLIIL
ncbi:unnamed protein product [Dracunculus medinensis]|uniref:FAT domain-containing protein n=1 Tax=Dracunculus medinensis TaxID=318479 RepID=A0A158Q521_DRAME|nr:unnamed protein product [Dracunculus medinensis]